jgi:phosphonate transport system substrate-binding protein
MKNIFRSTFLSLCLAAAALAVSACQPVDIARPPTATLTLTATITPTPTLGPTETPYPTATATPEPPGSAANPIIIAGVSGDQNPQMVTAANNLADQISVSSGLQVKSRLYKDYPALLAGLSDHQVQLAWLPPFTYLYSNYRKQAEAALVTNHFGIYAYSSQFMVNAASGFKVYFDPLKNQNTADSPQALAQFKEKRPCLVDEQSAPGYVVPLGLLAANQVTTQKPAFVQTFNAVIRALYVGGICDFGVTYSSLGDPLTSSGVLADLPDAAAKVVVVYRTDAIIPNLVLAVSPDLQNSLRKTVLDVLVALGKTDAGMQLLSDANNYSISGLQPIDDTFFDQLRGYIQAGGFDVKNFVGR